jgi:hypothetical protein
MGDTWRGIYPITSFVLEALTRKRAAAPQEHLSEAELTLLAAAEFWAAAARGTLESYLQPEPLAQLRIAKQAFTEMGAVRVVSLLRVAVDALSQRSIGAQDSHDIILHLDERLARTDDNVEDLIARYAGNIANESAQYAAVL